MLAAQNQQLHELQKKARLIKDKKTAESSRAFKAPDRDMQAHDG